MSTKDFEFEQGPIRPPNEAQSLLLRFTRNCPWNRCEFCPVYKGRKFSLRSVADIKDDIRTARAIADEITAASWRIGCGGQVTDAVVSQVFNSGSHASSYRSVAAWMYYGTGACFLQDADNLIMRTDDLVDVLTYLRQVFPEIKRVTTYSRSRTVTRKSSESLKRIHASGLDRVHIGLETGYDPLLKLVKKGVTGAQHVEAGRKLVEAGMQVSEYVMPGLGGREMWREHAVETARVLNQINPHFIRLRSLRIPSRVPLHARLKDGSFHMLTDDELAEEIRVFIEHLDGIRSYLASDHILNLLEEVEGRLPGDKPALLGVIDRYLGLPAEERQLFQLGRRLGLFRNLSDREDPDVRARALQIKDKVAAQFGGDLEGAIRTLAERYI
jgi:radical SAM superfamily enzyme YgiQ (UPF0313 family)